MNSLTESLYRGLDKLLFGARAPDVASAVAREAADVRFFVRVGGYPLADVYRGVRAYLGTGHALPIEVYCRQSGARVCSAHVWMDHRSLIRSVACALNKLPSVLALAGREAVRQLEPGELHGKDMVAPPTRGTAVMLFSLARAICRSMFRREQWTVATGAWDEAGTCFTATALIQPPADRFWADPFLAELDGKRWLFFEELVYAENRGKISALALNADGHAVGEPLVVLDLPYHLSYPFMIRHEGALYMIPESSANKTVDLYRNDGKVDAWTKVSTLLSGDRWADSTVIEFQGRWWMFATRADALASMHDELVVFWANDLAGPWQAHAANPVKIDAKTSRPAGAMWIEDGCIHRPVQDCSQRYGGGIRIQRVFTLTPDLFEEEDLGLAKARGVSTALGAHTLSRADGLACIDVMRSVFRMA